MSSQVIGFYVLKENQDDKNTNCGRKCSCRCLNFLQSSIKSFIRLITYDYPVFISLCCFISTSDLSFSSLKFHKLLLVHVAFNSLLNLLEWFLDLVMWESSSQSGSFTNNNWRIQGQFGVSQRYSRKPKSPNQDNSLKGIDNKTVRRQ